MLFLKIQELDIEEQAGTKPSSIIPAMSFFPMSRTFGTGAALRSITVLLWGVWPNLHRYQDLIISGPWRLVLDWPAMVRIGDTGKIR